MAKSHSIDAYERLIQIIPNNSKILDVGAGKIKELNWLT